MKIYINLLFCLIAFSTFFQSLNSSNYIDRKLNYILSNQENIDLFLDYFNNFKSYQDWNSVNSIQLVGTLLHDENLYNLVIYKKNPNKIKLVISRDTENSPKIIQIQNNKEAYCYSEFPNGLIKTIDPIVNFPEDIILMPRIMHLLINNLGYGWKLKIKNSSDTFNLNFYSDENKTKGYNFVIDKNSGIITEYTKNINNDDFVIKRYGEIQSGKLRHPRRVEYISTDHSITILFDRFYTNIGIPNFIFEKPKKFL